jgi:hypothetical protein
MKTDKDILKECSELKEMPFGVPEGYFESFRSRMTPALEAEKSRYGRFSPYIAMAAMFVLIVTGGTFFLRNTTPAEEFTQEDFVMFSSNLTNTIYYEDTDHLADAEIADEDIIEYLIYSGISAEEVELAK